ncbi:MAG: hypothetical protein L0Y71_01650 [Gemmataceae bacterium]|nr:hypothetical protein [Gemmataceae bacterium]
MQLALGFVMFVLAFAMLIAGIGLLVGGEITLKSGKKIPKLAGRKAGVALVSFIPVFVIVRTIVRWFDPEQSIPIESISWPLAGLCLGLPAIWLLRGMTAVKPQPRYTLSAASPFEASPFEASAFNAGEPLPPPAVILPDFDVPAAPPPEAPAAQPPRSRRPAKDPFDFS